MIDKDFVFTVTGDDGKDVLCQVFSIINRNEEEKNPLIIYTDFKQGDDNKLNLYVSEVINNDGEYTLGPVDDAAYENIPRVRNEMERIWNQKNSKNAI